MVKHICKKFHKLQALENPRLGQLFIFNFLSEKQFGLTVNLLMITFTNIDHGRFILNRAAPANLRHDHQRGRDRRITHIAVHDVLLLGCLVCK